MNKCSLIEPILGRLETRVFDTRCIRQTEDANADAVELRSGFG